jgi:hypothetical protein
MLKRSWENLILRLSGDLSSKKAIRLTYTEQMGFCQLGAVFDEDKKLPVWNKV